MNKLFNLLLFVFIFNSIHAIDYKLIVKVENCEKDKALLVSTFGLDIKIIDTLYNVNNSFVYTFSNQVLPGSYQLFFSKKKSLDFIYNFENIEIETNYSNLSQNPLILKSKENQILYSFLQDLSNIQSKIGMMNELYNLYEDDNNFTKRISKESSKLMLEERKLYEKFSSNSENLLVNEVIKIYKPILIPQKISHENENEYISEHWFDEFNFDNSSIINLKIYNDKVFELFNILVNAERSKEYVENSIIKSIAILLDKSKNNELIVKYNLDLLSFMFGESDLETVMVFINEQLIKEKACINEEHEKSLKEQIDSFKKLQVGKLAPDFQLPFENQVIQLSKIENEYILILFWASWCPHCLDELPALKEIYEDYQKNNFEIVAISLDSDLKLWKEFIRDENFDWINYCDGKSWESELVTLYDVNETPKLFLIDENRTIISKPSNSLQLRKKLEELIPTIDK